MRVLGIVSVVIGMGLVSSATAQQPQPAKAKPAKSNAVRRLTCSLVRSDREELGGEPERSTEEAEQHHGPDR